jgi:hypothetical protein
MALVLSAAACDDAEQTAPAPDPAATQVDEAPDKSKGIATAKPASDEPASDEPKQSRYAKQDAERFAKAVSELHTCKGDIPSGCKATRHLMRAGAAATKPLAEHAMDRSNGEDSREMAALAFLHGSKILDPELAAPFVEAAKLEKKSTMRDLLLGAAAKCKPTEVGPVLELYIEGQVEFFLPFPEAIKYLDGPAATKWLLENFEMEEGKRQKAFARTILLKGSPSDTPAIEKLIESAPPRGKLALASAAIYLGDASKYQVYFDALGGDLAYPAMTYIEIHREKMSPAVREQAITALEAAKTKRVSNADMYSDIQVKLRSI